MFLHSTEENENCSDLHAFQCLGLASRDAGMGVPCELNVQNHNH